MPCRFPGAHPGGSLGDLARGISRPKPKGEVEGDLARGISRPKPKGEVKGDLACGGGGGLQAHTWGDLQAHTRGNACSKGGVETPHDGYCCGRYASYSNAFLLTVELAIIKLIIS